MTRAVEVRRFAPGDGYAVAGDDVVVLLPASAKARVPGIWEAADAGASAERLLDIVLSDGLSSLSDLALVSHLDGAVRVLVRGAPRPRR